MRFPVFAFVLGAACLLTAPRAQEPDIDPWLDGVADEEALAALEPVVEALEGMKVVRDGTTVSVEMSVAKVDVRKTLLALLKVGM